MENNKKQQFFRTGSKAFQSSDSNRKTDIQTSKPFVRNTRRGEQSQSSRNEPPRNNKQASASGRQRLDKRPRPRPRGGGNYYGTNANAVIINNTNEIEENTNNINNAASKFEKNNAKSSRGAFDSLTSQGNDIDAAGSGLVLSGGGQGESRTRARRINDQMHALNSVYTPGTKKQNLNHLLNFHFAERELDTPNFNPFGRNFGSSSSSYNGHRYSNLIAGGGGFKKFRYSKEQYLQANFQFVISHRTNFVVYSPDALIDWDQIEQINMKTTEEPKCPICLYPVSAAKITRCGHVYCWVCMIHYLAISKEEKSSKCPLCHENVCCKDLKSVLILPQQTFKEGDQITFQLMRRKKGSLLIEKYSSIEHKEDTESYPMYSSNDQMKLFSKFIMANDNNILDIIDREERDLMATCDEEGGIDAYTSIALAELKIRRETLRGKVKIEENIPIECKSCEGKDTSVENLIFTPICNEQNDAIEFAQEERDAENAEKFTKIINGKQEDIIKQEIQDIPEMEENLLSTEKTIENCNSSTSSKNENECTKSLLEEITVGEYVEPIGSAGVGNGAKYYYFYQCDDGQNLFLHPLNIKMLQVNYGTLDLAPLKIKARIMQKENYSMDKDYRRKFTCLGHLPLTCQFGVYEVDLRPPIITREVRDLFKDDLIVRKKKRDQRKREEMRHEKKINEMNNRQFNKFVEATHNITINSSADFPEFGFEEYLPAVTQTTKESTLATSANAPSNARKATSYSEVTTRVDSPVEDFPAWSDTIASTRKQTGKNLTQSNSLENNVGNANSDGNELPTWSNIASNKQIANRQMSIKKIANKVSGAVTATATTTAASSLPNKNEIQQIRDQIVDSEGMISVLRNTNLGDVLAEAISQKKHSGDTIGGNMGTNSDAGYSSAAFNIKKNKNNKKNKKMIPLFSTGINYNGN